MMKNMSKIYQLLAILLIMAISVSCAGAPATIKPVNIPPASSAALKAIDIVGIREWKPLQEGTLNCALDGDDDNTLKYTWSAEQGTIKGEGKEVTWIAPNIQGDFKVTVEVSNPKGEGTSFSRSFKVTDNPYNNFTPDATIYLNLSLPSTSVVTGSGHPKVFTTSEIECVVAGKDASELTFKWTAPTGKLAGNGLADGKSSRVGWIAPGVAGNYKVSVTVTDKSGNSASGEVNFNVYCCRP
ncbi:MAG: hypothetical protein NTZ34_00210 [Chloroflexi bacterium]|nr:hypothetical protein [Chloroflexota bacterium]